MILQGYIKNLRMNGRQSFVIENVQDTLGISRNYARVAIHRLLQSGDLVSPVRGLYVIVPPEYQMLGSIPAEMLVPLVMKHLQVRYYVGLLSAALFYGASHQKPARFQVVVQKRMRSRLVLGRVAIEFVYKDNFEYLPTKEFVEKTGYLKVATPELIVIDLFKYMRKSGGLSHIATVFSELVVSVNAKRLIQLADQLDEICQIQRFGYIVERIDWVDNEKQRQKLLRVLAKYLTKIDRPYIPLVPYLEKTGFSRNKKWKIIENSDFESDL